MLSWPSLGQQGPKTLTFEQISLRMDLDYLVSNQLEWSFELQQIITRGQ